MPANEFDLPSVPSPDEVWLASTSDRGFTAATLHGWGISWPPPKGWRQKLAMLHYAQTHGAQVVTTAGPMEARIIPTEAMREKLERSVKNRAPQIAANMRKQNRLRASIPKPRG